MLLDNTPSMRLARRRPTSTKTLATPTLKNGSDGTWWHSLCHIVSTSGVEDKNSYYNIARTTR